MIFIKDLGWPVDVLAVEKSGKVRVMLYDQNPHQAFVDLAELRDNAERQGEELLATIEKLKLPKKKVKRK